MITATLQGEKIKTIGTILDGDIYPGFCCDGFDWEVQLIFPDKNPNWNSIWGACHNPDCQNYQRDIGPSDPYRGVSQISQEDLEEWLASRKPNNVFVAEASSSARKQNQ